MFFFFFYTTTKKKENKIVPPWLGRNNIVTHGSVYINILLLFFLVVCFFGLGSTNHTNYIMETSPQIEGG